MGKAYLNCSKQLRTKSTLGTSRVTTSKNNNKGNQLGYREIRSLRIVVANQMIAKMMAVAADIILIGIKLI